MVVTTPTKTYLKSKEDSSFVKGSVEWEEDANCTRIKIAFNIGHNDTSVWKKRFKGYRITFGKDGLWKGEPHIDITDNF
jgi:hypothetical protein